MEICGGIVGFAGTTTSTLSDCTVRGVSQITGTASVGGIAGRTYSSISKCSASVTTIGNATFPADALGNEWFKLYIGGIAGYTTGTIETSSVTVSYVGNGNVVMNDTSKREGNILGIFDYGGTNVYIVGGIAGWSSGYINKPNTMINSSVKVRGGKILYRDNDSFPDPLGVCATGGLVGYRDYNQEASKDAGWQFDCYVSGYDNVGGIIGYNNKGSIKNITRTTTVRGSGENIGGIVGLNQGGDIAGCTNNATVTRIEENDDSPYGENVGGIVGANNGKEIRECINNATVTGDRNVGGIAGCSYGKWIVSCKNNAEIIGKSNTMSQVASNNLIAYYSITNQYSTGTGGIAGKIYNVTIVKSANYGKITCNYQGGGITGVCAGGAIKYSFNLGKITNDGVKQLDLVTGNTISKNRIGGICGAGLDTQFTNCYNCGDVSGIQNNTSFIVPIEGGFRGATGGIIGFLIDDSSHIDFGNKYNVSTKYFEFDLGYIDLESYHNTIAYCYSAGTIKGGHKGNVFNDNRYCGGIVGYVAIGLDVDLSEDALSTTDFINNYYLEGSSSAGGRNNKNGNGYQPLKEYKLKEQLYIWANTLKVPSYNSSDTKDKLKDNEYALKFSGDVGKYIYNTTAPLQVETNKGYGYKGFGVLWWQIKDYVKLTTNMFMCKRIEGKADTYIKFPNTAYQPITYINGAAIDFRNIIDDANSNFENLCIIDAGFSSNKPVKTSGYYKWIMMVPKGTYKIKGTTPFSENAQFFNSTKKLAEGTEYSINIQSDTQISVAPIIEFISATLNTKNISVVWDRVNTDVEAESNLFNDIYDANHNKINKVRGYYELDPNDSKATIKNGGKSVSVYLDKYDQLVKQQPIRFYRFEYYTREQVRPSIWAWEWYYKYNGPYVTNEGTDSGKKGKAEEASCEIYIEVQNLIDLLGNNVAKDMVPHTAEVHMDYKINMWFEKGDFWSNFTNIFNMKDSYLDYKISIQKNSGGAWQDLEDLHGKKDTVTNSQNQKITSEKFEDDGHYNIYYTINGQDISASLADVKYNDRLRIKVDVTFKSISEYAYFDVNSAKLDVTYGHKDIMDAMK